METEKIKNKEWKCCDTRLGEFIDENRVNIRGNNGQPYEIGFMYIWLICKKCGKKHYIKSPEVEKMVKEADKKDMHPKDITIPVGKVLPRSYKNILSHLPHFDQKKAKRSLSTIKKRVFELLEKCGDPPSKEEMTEISRKVGVPYSKVNEYRIGMTTKIFEIRRKRSEENKL